MISPGEVVLHRSDGLEHLVSSLARPLAVPRSAAALTHITDPKVGPREAERAPAAQEACAGPHQLQSNVPSPAGVTLHKAKLLKSFLRDG